MMKKPKEFKRICPICESEILYKSYTGWWTGNNKNSNCRSCATKLVMNTLDFTGENNPFFGKTHSKETKDKIRSRDMSSYKTHEFRKKMSEVTKGERNARYKGKNNYQIWLDKYGKEEADKKLDNYKEKQRRLNSGENNNMFGKPSPQGAGNGWSGWYKDWYFRSLRELSFMINYIENNNLSWISAESKEFEIKYKYFDDTERSYRADFLIENKYLVEVKPNRLINSPLVKLKTEAAIKFCDIRGLEYKIIDCQILSDKEILTLYNDGLIKFLPRYEEKFKERYLIA
jgi:hypothetical protein